MVFKLTCHPHALAIPCSWKKQRMVFVNSMSDLFHEDVPKSFIKKVFDIMNTASQHQYQVLTKRYETLFKINVLKIMLLSFLNNGVVLIRKKMVGF